MLTIFFETDTFHISKKGITLDLIPERLRGEIVTFDIKGKKGKVLVESEQRITAWHIREIIKAGVFPGNNGGTFEITGRY